MTTVSVLQDFVTKYSLPEDGVKELLDIFNKSLVNISTEILQNNNINSDKYYNKNTKNTKNTINTKNSDNTIDGKKFVSKKAEEYAKENNLSIDDFDLDKISKKDVENKVREIAKNNKSNSSGIKIDTSTTTTTTTTKLSPKKDKIICSGLTKKGEACNKVGCQQPDGAKNKYCFRHAEDWKAFECDSDSSDDDDNNDDDDDDNNTLSKINTYSNNDDDDDNDDEIKEELPIKP
jgi:hypothetical protein